MSMIYQLYEASDATIQRLLTDTKLIYDFLGAQPPEAWRRPGLLSRLFGIHGRTAESMAEPVTFDLDCDKHCLGQAWHGIHFLLTETAWDGDLPEGFLINGGTEIGSHDVGYGPAIAHSSDEVAAFHQFLENVTADELRSRFDPQQMSTQQLYPPIWETEGDEAFEYLWESYDALKAFVAAVASRQNGIVTCLG